MLRSDFLFDTNFFSHSFKYLLCLTRAMKYDIKMKGRVPHLLYQTTYIYKIRSNIPHDGFRVSFQISTSALWIIDIWIGKAWGPCPGIDNLAAWVL